METNVCKKCGVEKPIEKYRKYKNGFYTTCKACCSLKWSLNNKDYRKNYDKEYYKKNKEKKDLAAKKSTLKNKEKYKKVKDAYYQENKKEIIKRKNRRVSERMKIDLVFLVKTKVRWSIKTVFSRTGYTKKSRTQDILGISFDEFKIYIETQFLEGMSWDNHGKWHLDHKTPISWATTEEEVYKLNYYTNFQPLWACDNLSKGNKFNS
jgi:hypothetical protein